MHAELVQHLLGAASGTLVGLSLGLFGGGGSILAVPLLIYVVGVTSTHLAIGTSAVAVSVNALVNLVIHARRGNVNWRCAGIYGVAGVIGAALGASLGKAVDGDRLLLLFALLMVVVAALMFRRRNEAGNPAAACGRDNAGQTLAYGASTGALSGFFGIGGGFLIVPGLMAATGMPMLTAVGSSLLPVTLFGLTTAASYAWSGLVDWVISIDFILGGIAGGLAGAALAQHLAVGRGVLAPLFSAAIFATAVYVVVRSVV